MNTSGKSSVVARLLALILAGAVLTLGLISCGMTVKAGDLMADIEPGDVEGKACDDAFVRALAEFSLALYRESGKEVEENENFLVSPLSAATALGMTAIGADGNTRAQFEEMFGLSIEDMSAYMSSYLTALAAEEKDVKLAIANSIWFDHSFIVSRDFLSANKAYYRAQMYSMDFGDKKTADAVNDWVKKNTDGMIEKLVDAFEPGIVMCLVNAVCFDAAWEEKYEKSDIIDGAFHGKNGDTAVKMLCSTELRYLETEDGTRGMMKNYKGGKYAFAAFLPDEKMDIDAFVSSLSGTRFLSLMENMRYERVQVRLPKFSYDCDLSLVKPLMALGLTDAFDGKADFRGISGEQLFISDVIHKTHIELDEAGTKAAAVTGVLMEATGMPSPMSSLILNRPFVYAIVDTETNLPIFIGTIKDLGK